jgi:hypothetical protein
MEEYDELLLARLLLQESMCASIDEATAVVGSMREDVVECRSRCGSNANNDLWEQLLQEYLGVSKEEAVAVLGTCRTQYERATLSLHGSNDETSGTSDEEVIAIENGDDDDDDDSIIGPGLCVFCERGMKLTRHHLIPKSTWRRLEAKLVTMATAASSNQVWDNEDGRLSHLVPQIRDTAALLQSPNCKINTGTVRHVLRQQTVDLCRPCHSQVHRLHDNMTLAREYNTADRLLADPSIFKFAKWASQQRAGRYK